MFETTNQQLFWYHLSHHYPIIIPIKPHKTIAVLLGTDQELCRRLQNASDVLVGGSVDLGVLIPGFKHADWYTHGLYIANQPDTLQKNNSLLVNVDIPIFIPKD